MEIILLERVAALGNLGDKVRVRPGYARNFLIPRGKAQAATSANLAAFEARRAELEQTQAAAQAVAQARADRIAALGTLNLSVKAGEEGKLFGSVGAADIAAALAQAGIEVDRHDLRLPQGPLRHIGEHVVGVHLHTDVNADLRVNLTAA